MSATKRERCYRTEQNKWRDEFDEEDWKIYQQVSGMRGICMRHEQKYNRRKQHSGCNPRPRPPMLELRHLCGLKCTSAKFFLPRLPNVIGIG